MTTLVRAGGAGSYTVADVQSGTGLDRYAGWSLVVAYNSPGAPPRNLTLFDGFETVNSDDPPHEFTVHGFRTPPFGPVRSALGFVAYEGDRSLGGDNGSLNGTKSAENLFSSRISRFGQAVSTKAPDYDNQLGFDAQVLNTTGILGNGAMSAAIRLETTGDTYLPGVGWMVTELFAPDVQSDKSVIDLNGGLVEPGDELEYTIRGTNRGQDAAASVIVTDPVPANTTFVPGSLRVTGGADPGALSDAVDADRAEFDAGAGQVGFRVGAGATATAGGRLGPGEGYEVRYRARVAATVANGATIINQARTSLLAETLGFPVNAVTNETRLTVSSPDLTIGKAFTGTVAPGQTVTYTLTVSNLGQAASRGEVVVIDPMPPTTSFFAPAGTGWACVQTPAFGVTCTRSDSLPAGASWPPITITGVVLSVPVGGLINTSQVSGGGDVNQANNTATAAPPNAPIVSLAVDKQVTPDTVAPGEEVSYLLTVSNRGGFGPATGVQLIDPLPAGLTLRSASAPDQGSCTGAVSCSLGTLPGGASARVRVAATVNANAASGNLNNTATVVAAQADVFPDDDTDDATVKVRTTADLRVSKQMVGTPTAGGPVRWTVTLVNDGPNGVAGGVFNDVVPAVVQNAGATVAGGSCTASGRLLSCALPSIAPGGRARIEIAGTLPTGAGGEPLANGVQVVPLAFVRPPLDSASTRPDAVALPAADVGVAKVATPAPAARNGRITYHVRATNHGPSKATSVVIRDTLPPGTRFVAATNGRGCKARKRVVRCALGRIDANRSVELDIVARLDTGRRARSVGNRVTIDAAEPDPASANNRHATSSALAPRLLLRKSVDRPRAALGDALRYRLRLSNRGPGTAHKVVLCDRPGAGLKLRRAPGARRTGRGRCWRIGTLASGRSVTRRVVATITDGTTDQRINRASVRVGAARAAVAQATVRLRTGAPGPCPAVTRAAGRREPIARAAC